MAYIIVKYPSQIPENVKVNPSFSVHDTYSGKQCELQPSYRFKPVAFMDLCKIQEYNPSVEYGIREALEE